MRLLVLCFVISLPAVLWAQPDTLWTRVIGGDSEEQVSSIRQTHDGGFIIAGSTRSYGAGGSDVLLVKLDSIGNVQWTHTYGDSRDETGADVRELPEGGYVVVGNQLTDTNSNIQILWIITDEIGDALLSRTYSFYPSQTVTGIVRLSNGDFVLSGYRGEPPSPYDYYRIAGALLLRVNPAGDTLSQERGPAWGDLGWGEISGWTDAESTFDGGAIFSGYDHSWDTPPMRPRRDIYYSITERYDEHGASLWSKSYSIFTNYPASRWWKNVVESFPDGTILTTLGDDYLGNAHILHLSSVGDMLSQFSLNPYHHPVDLRLGPRGGLVTLDNVADTLTGSNFHLRALNSNGYLLWERTLPHDGNDDAVALESVAGGYIAVGTTGVGSLANIFVARFNPEWPPLSYPQLIQAGPPQWGYRIVHVSGHPLQLVFTHLCPGTSGHVGGAAAASWSVLPNGDGNNGDSIIFRTASYAAVASLDTFWITHPACAGFTWWAAEDTNGTIYGPYSAATQAVQLNNFLATDTDTAIWVRFSTAFEQHTASLELWRQRGSQSANRINAYVPQGAGHIYTYVDTAVWCGYSYTYNLFSTDSFGYRYSYPSNAATVFKATHRLADFAVADYQDSLVVSVDLAYECLLSRIHIMRSALYANDFHEITWLLATGLGGEVRYNFADSHVDRGVLYWYYPFMEDMSGHVTSYLTEMDSATAGGTPPPPVVYSYSLAAFPNPFNPSTTIRFSLPQNEHIKVCVYDVRGRLVSTLSDADYRPGEYQLLFDGSRLSTGLYFARLEGSVHSSTVKLMLLK